jgi:hypothetical protein
LPSSPFCPPSHDEMAGQCSRESTCTALRLLQHNEKKATPLDKSRTEASRARVAALAADAGEDARAESTAAPRAERRLFV